MNIEHLLVPTDLTGAGAHAYPHAAALARMLNASVTVLHVDEVVIWTDSRQGLEPAVTDHIDHLERRREKILARFESWGVPARFEVVKGMPRRKIPAAMADLGVDMVVIPRRSRSRLRWLLLGSTTERVLRTATVPVLVTVRGDDGEDKPLPRYPRAVAATNLGAESVTALRTVLPLLERLDSRLTLTHIGREPRVISHRGWDTPAAILSRGEAATELLIDEHLERICGQLGEGIERCVRIGRDPGSEIVKVAEAERASLIALAASGRGRRRLGSTAARVVQRSTVPVLVVPNPTR